jgi:hypothetical protein
MLKKFKFGMEDSAVGSKPKASLLFSWSWCACKNVLSRTSVVVVKKPLVCAAALG